MRLLFHTVLFLAGFALMCSSCLQGSKKTDKEPILETAKDVRSDVIEEKDEKNAGHELSALEKYFIACGLINVKEIDSTILVDIRYATADNFTGQLLYDSLDKCYLQTEVAGMLKKANDELKKVHPGSRLLVWDAVRPFSVQQKMWEAVKGTANERYVAPPVSGSLHNFGCAVDVTIVDHEGLPLDMGTDFDYFGKKAEPRHHEQLLKEGMLTKTQLDNRYLLKTVMKRAGFKAILTEWWHFNAFHLEVAKRKFKRLDGPEAI